MNEERIVRAAAARGATLAETAAELGCSVATARRLWRALGLPMARRGPRPSAPGHVVKVERKSRARRTTDKVGGGGMDETQIVRAAAARGASIVETAAQLGCSQSRARRLWVDLGLPIPPRGRRPGSCSGAQAPDYVAEVERELRAGRTIGEVARERGVTRQAISDLARRYGFPVQALRRSAGWGMTFRRSGSATTSGGEKDLRGVMVWVPRR